MLDTYLVQSETCLDELGPVDCPLPIFEFLKLLHDWHEDIRHFFGDSLDIDGINRDQVVTITVKQIKNGLQNLLFLLLYDGFTLLVAPIRVPLLILYPDLLVLQQLPLVILHAVIVLVEKSAAMLAHIAPRSL